MVENYSLEHTSSLLYNNVNEFEIKAQIQGVG